MGERLLSDKDWDRIGRLMAGKTAGRFTRSDLSTGYIVRVEVEALPPRTAAVRGQDMVLTIRRTFPNGSTSSQNFDTAEEARQMLYG